MGGIYHDARITDFYVPTADGHYYLADVGFPNSVSLMHPYRGVHYHLQEWSCAALSFSIVYYNTMIILFLHFHNSPANPQELFNLWHASAHNIVEHIFGILKNCFTILRANPNLDVDTQAQIAPALAAIHNFI